MEARLRKVIEPGRAVGKSNGGSEGHGKLRVNDIGRSVLALLRFADQRPARFENGYLDPLDLLGPNIVLLRQPDQAVDGRLHVAAAGVRLHARSQDFKVFAQITCGKLGERFARIRRKKSIATLENRARPLEPFRGELR